VQVFLNNLIINFTPQASNLQIFQVQQRPIQLNNVIQSYPYFFKGCDSNLEVNIFQTFYPKMRITTLKVYTLVSFFTRL